MPLVDRTKALLDRKTLRPFLTPLISQAALWQRKGVKRIFYDRGVWIHDTAYGYFAYPQPYVRLSMAQLERFTQSAFFWGFRPTAGNVIVDVGAGVGEDTLAFSKAVGENGRVICIEAHPRTCRCLQKLVEYNRLNNSITIHRAISAPGCSSTSIEDSVDYLRNRIVCGSGISVPASTLDDIVGELGLHTIHFLKMNIEGAERFAIQGMRETLKRTQVLCISCHDFLAEKSGDSSLCTKAAVKRFLREHGLRVVERLEPGQPAYFRDQVWAYQEALRCAATG